MNDDFTIAYWDDALGKHVPEPGFQGGYSLAEAQRAYDTYWPSGVTNGDLFLVQRSGDGWAKVGQP